MERRAGQWGTLSSAFFGWAAFAFSGGRVDVLVGTFAACMGLACAGLAVAAMSWQGDGDE